MTRKISVAICAIMFAAVAFGASDMQAPPFPISPSEYPQAETLSENLSLRVESHGFNIFASAIFLCALFHTFFYREFEGLSKKVQKGRIFRLKEDNRNMLSRALHFLGEVELVFAVWLVPLFIAYVAYFGWTNFTYLIHDMAFIQNKYAEPVFVAAIMIMASTKPIIALASSFISLFARIGGGSIKAWWCSILCVGPLLGSLITEPAAITICAVLLMKHFFNREPSVKFKYTTLALLFVAISVGGTLTHFAAPPVLMVARTWDWGLAHMFFSFGWKAAIGIFLSVGLACFLNRKEFALMEKNKSSFSQIDEIRTPAWITVAHIVFLTATVLVMHHLAMVLALLLLFMAFIEVTKEHQSPPFMRSAIFVSVFLAALVTHGAFQSWWIEPVLLSLKPGSLYIASIVLTAFNDNAAITYLASLVPDFSDSMKYLVVAGAVTGGGLTIIANAPNLAGFSILKNAFSKGLSPRKLFLSALLPTVIIALIFYFIP